MRVGDSFLHTRRSDGQTIFETYGRPDIQVEYWRPVSLTDNIEFLERPIQLHHADDDTVVTIDYSFDLAADYRKMANPTGFTLTKVGVIT